MAAIAGFGIGSLMTPLLAIEFGTKTAVLLVAIPHATATALRLWLLRADVDRRVLLDVRSGQRGWRPGRSSVS